MEVDSVGTASRSVVTESKMRRFFLLERIMVDLVVVDDARIVKYFAVN
jgi:hypothetical protein